MQNPEQHLADELERRINGTQNSEHELGELAGIAQGLKNLPRPEANAHAKENCTKQLLEHSPNVVRWYKNKQILAWAAAIFLMFTIAGGGAVSASRDSMPGEVLYPVKRLYEDAQMILTVSPSGKAERYLIISERRLKEFMASMNLGVIQPEVLSSMLEANRRAISLAGDIPDSKRELIFAEISSLCSLQGTTLSQCCLMPEDTALVRAAIAECLSCQNCVPVH
ncbi:MAG: hypothetical protein IPP40_12315 [bacterium]|nr:hypothetical protein [bacterium]